MSPSGDTSVRLLAAALCGLAVAVSIQALFGFLGVMRVGPIAVAVAETILALCFLALRFRHHGVASNAPVAATPSPVWNGADWAGATALATALGERLWAGLHRTTYFYDVLSYHLHLPASWRASGHLAIVPTPFGDPAAAYAPSNAALIAHLLIAATGNARLAHAGQLPFALLSSLALYATARVVGASRAAGFAGALAFLLIPEVWQQAPTAMADLATAAFFLAAVPFLLRLGNSPGGTRARRWMDIGGLGLALGLLLGTKYVSVALALPLLACTAVALARGGGGRGWGWGRGRGRGRGRAAGAVVALAVGCGGFWYVRNTLVTGNPLFPATLRLGSWTVARGLSDASQLRSSPYHLPIADLKALLDIFTETGWGFLGGVALALALAARRPWRWLGFAAVLLSIAWLLIPFQESRFFFPLWGILIIILFAVTVDAPRVGAAALLAATLGSVLQFPTSGRLAVGAAALVGGALGPRWGSALLSTCARWLRAPSRRAARSLASSFALAVVPCALVVIALVGLVAWARGAPLSAPYSVGDAHDEAWAWMQARPSPSPHGRQIAYAGSNLPLPLWGSRFENRVSYAGVAAPPTSVLGGGHRGRPPAPVLVHDFIDVASAPAFASSMGSSEPAPERQFPVQSVWLSNLEALGADLLFVAALYPNVRRSIAHDSEGFPVERAWADAAPRRFSLLFANAGVRIYAVHPRVAP